MNKFKACFEVLDNFGYKPELSIDRKYVYTSICGGVINLVLYMVLIYIGLTEFIQFYH